MVLPSVCERSVSRAGRETVHKTTREGWPAIRAGHVDTGADDPTGHDGFAARVCRASPAKRRAGAGARPLSRSTDRTM